jgi:hypothetical protein
MGIGRWLEICDDPDHCDWKEDEGRLPYLMMGRFEGENEAQKGQSSMRRGKVQVGEARGLSKARGGDTLSAAARERLDWGRTHSVISTRNEKVSFEHGFFENPIHRPASGLAYTAPIVYPVCISLCDRQ